MLPLWRKKNARASRKSSLHAQKLILERGLRARNFTFEHVVGIWEERYRRLVTDFLQHELDSCERDDIWFQRNCASCRTACDTINLLREKFSGSAILKLNHAKVMR